MTTSARSESIFRKRIRKFRRLKRGYYSFLVLVTAYVISLALPVLVNNRALVVRYNGRTYFPVTRYYPASAFGVNAIGEPNYRQLRDEFEKQGGGNWVLMPPYPYSPTEALLELPGFPPHAPQKPHIFGTDDRGRDVFASCSCLNRSACSSARCSGTSGASSIFWGSGSSRSGRRFPSFTPSSS
jgi:ABC-type microcin C transport system permease subunit YejE